MHPAQYQQLTPTVLKNMHLRLFCQEVPSALLAADLQHAKLFGLKLQLQIGNSVWLLLTRTESVLLTTGT